VEGFSSIARDLSISEESLSISEEDPCIFIYQVQSQEVIAI